MIHFVEFSQERQPLYIPVCLPVTQALSEKGYTLKGTNIL